MPSRDFRLYLISRFCAGTAMTMMRAAVGWHVFALSHSAFHLGLIGLIQFIPALILSLVGGAVADAFDRRRVMMLAQTGALGCSALLFATTAGGGIRLELLYLAVFLSACASAFDSPARAALMPTLVAREHFARAVTIASTNQALAFVTGPAAGGVIIGAAGVQAAYATHMLLVAVSILTLSSLRVSRPPESRAAITWQSIREGLAFVRHQQVLLGCMTLDMFAVILGGATALLPIFANEILQVGAHGYGILSSSLELGALLTSAAMAFLPPVRRTGRALLIAVVFYGVATIAFGLSRWFPLSLVAYMAVGVADQVSVIMRSIMIQLATPDELRGRVSSVSFIFIGASNQLGAAESGFVAALTSAQFAVVSGGIGSLIVVAAVALLLPQLRRYRVA